MNTAKGQPEITAAKTITKLPLDQEEVYVTMDIFFESMKDRRIFDSVELYNKAKAYAVSTFGISEELGRMLSGHEGIKKLLTDPRVQELNSKSRKNLAPRAEAVIHSTKSQLPLPETRTKSPSAQTVKPVVPQNASSVQASKSVPQNTSPVYVNVPVDTSSVLPSIDDAFRSGDLGLIARILGKGGHDVEEVNVQGWGKMTTLPPPVDSLIGKIIHPNDLKNLLESYNKAINFQPVSEIRKLQDGDVVNFKKLQRTMDGKYIQHFRIIKINEVRTANNDYEILCVANCIFIKCTNPPGCVGNSLS